MTPIQNISRLLRSGRIDEAVDIYASFDKHDSKLKDVFKRYLNKHIPQIKDNIKILSSLACIFVNDDKYINEYNIIKMNIYDTLHKKQNNVYNNYIIEDDMVEDDIVEDDMVEDD